MNMLRWGRTVLAACLTAGSSLAFASPPTYVGAGATGIATTGDCVAGVPAGIQNNDILIMMSVSNDGLDHFVGGYTTKSEFTASQDNQSRGEIAWKRTTGSDTFATVSHSGGSFIMCQVTAWRGAYVTGDPFEAGGVLQNHLSEEGPLSTQNITTTHPNATILHVILSGNGTQYDTPTGVATNERVDVLNSPHISLGLWLASGTQAVAGPTGIAGATESGPFSSISSSTQLALREAVALPGAPGTPVFSSVLATSYHVAWSAASGATSYKVERAPDVAGSPGTFAEVASGVTVLGFDDSLRSPAMKYWFRVRASGAGGDGPYSSSASVTTVALPGAPGTPTFANIDANSVKVLWTAAANATSYTVEQAPDAGGLPGNFAVLATGVVVLSTTALGLDANTKYWFRVKGNNDGGDGPYSGNASVTLLAVPGVPGTPSYSSIAGTSLRVSWTASSSATSYRLEKAPDSGGSPGTYVEIASGVTALYRDVSSGLAAGSAYWFRVRGTNGSGDGSYSAGAMVTTLSAVGTPGTPTFSSVTGTSVLVTWTSASSANSYKLERAPDASGVAGTYTQLVAGLIGTTYSDSGLSLSTKYWYRVRGTNDIGDGSYSTGASTTTTNEVFQTGWLRYQCYAPDGNCLAVKQNGARVDFGSGATDYATSDGVTVSFAGPLRVGASTFANLPSVNDGTLLYCSNCTVANPCASGGSGAIAKRINSAWVCN